MTTRVKNHIAMGLMAAAGMMAPPSINLGHRFLPKPKHSNSEGHRRNSIRRQLQRYRSGPKHAQMQAAINRLTNWQRNQWARAGYPKDAAEITRFAELARRGS